MGKIGLMYLNVSNLGDLVIYETARYILQDILEKNHLEDYEIVPVDIGSYQYKVDGDFGFRDGFFRKTRRKISLVLGKSGAVHKLLPELSYALLRDSWHTTKEYAYYKDKERDKLDGLDMIVFGGGGLIKYHQQHFHYFLDDIIAYAQEKNIPVLINAQGVEGYSEDDAECQLLKKALNKDCVKYVSTRDSFPQLRNCYMFNPDIVVKKVCDPAFWLRETYGITDKEVPSGKIGLNVIRPKIFGQYMYSVNPESLAVVYRKLIKECLVRGYSVELFSNGADQDDEYVRYIKETYPALFKDPRVTTKFPKSTKGLVRTIAGYDRFMAVRLHASIIGTVLGIPNVSLVWNYKQTMFGEEVGMKENYITKDDFKASVILDKLFAAKPYRMDPAYKHSVYGELEKMVVRAAGSKESPEGGLL